MGYTSYLFLFMHVSAFTYDPYIGVKDQHAKLQFFRSDGETVNTTIEIERFGEEDPFFHIAIKINDSRDADLHNCENSFPQMLRDTMGYVHFNENCTKALIVFNPPPALRARITISINGIEEPYGPYSIGREGECCKIHHIHCKFCKISLILPNKWQLSLCM